MPFLSVKIPIKTVSEANRSSEHWAVKAKRHKKQQQIVSYLLSSKDRPNLPVQITLTRIAPRSLDSHENLPMSFKYIADSISEWILPGLAKGRADSDSRITWQYDQQKGLPKEYAIMITIASTDKVSGEGKALY